MTHFVNYVTFCRVINMLDEALFSVVLPSASGSSYDCRRQSWRRSCCENKAVEITSVSGVSSRRVFKSWPSRSEAISFNYVVVRHLQTGGKNPRVHATRSEMTRKSGAKSTAGEYIEVTTPGNKLRAIYPTAGTAAHSKHSSSTSVA